MDKLKHLLEHWIEHCKEHNAKYLEWTERIRDERPDVAELIVRAVERFEEGVRILEEAYRRI